MLFAVFLFAFLLQQAAGLQAASKVISFGFTGKVQNYTVPAEIYLVTVLAYGGQGGPSSNTAVVGGSNCVAGVSHCPAYGGMIQAAVSVIPGQVLQVYVGGAGLGNANAGGSTGGWNGGGNGDNGE